MIRSISRSTIATLALSLTGTTALGGTSSASETASRLQVNSSYWETQEYFNNWGHAAIGTSTALGVGATGRGVTVGVVDSGIDAANWEFVNRIHPGSADVYGDPIADQVGHGTGVASVIAGALDGWGTHGVAPEATILALRIDPPCYPDCGLEDRALAFATDHAVANQAEVINFSLGGPSPNEPVFRRALKRAAAADTVLVFSAGNSPTKRPGFPGRYVKTKWMNGQGIVVGALDDNGQIADFSARAGKAKNYYLVAPGTDIAVAAAGGGYELADGTSFAAPHVSGAAAAVLSAWPWLSGSEVVDILLGTAIDLGAAGVDRIYGHGLLNLAGAFAPVGLARLPDGDQAGDGGAPITGSELRAGGAFGRALASSKLLGRAIVVDDFGRDFALDLRRLVRADDGRVRAEDWTKAAPEALPFGSRDGEAQTRLAFGQAPFETRFGDRNGELQIERFALTESVSGSTHYALTRGFGIGGYFGLSASEGEAITALLRHEAFGSPFLALIEQGDGVVLGHEIADWLELRAGFTLQDGSDHPDDRSGGRSGYVAELRQTFESGAHVGAQVGIVDEEDGVLGATARGAFTMGGSASTRFVGLSGGLPLGERVEIYGHASLGWTDASGLSSALFDELGTVTTTAFGAGLAVKNVVTGSDRLDLTVSQPVRVESGSMQVVAAVGAREDGSLVRETERLGLAPDGRQLDLELAYRADLGGSQELRLNYVAQIEPGHDAGAGPEHFFGVRYGVKF